MDDILTFWRTYSMMVAEMISLLWGLFRLQWMNHSVYRGGSNSRLMTEIKSVGFKLPSDEKDDESGGDLKIGAYDEWRKEFSRGIRPCSSVHCFLLCSEISIHRRSGRIPPLNESKLISAT